MRFDSRWERLAASVSPMQVRAMLVVVGIVAMLLGGSADSIWT